MAACIVILCGAASAFGFDILQAFADWTAETFGFVTPGQEEAEAPQDDRIIPYGLLSQSLQMFLLCPHGFQRGQILLTISELLKGQMVLEFKQHLKLMPGNLQFGFKYIIPLQSILVYMK